jgi:hypothetical protein
MGHRHASLIALLTCIASSPAGAFTSDAVADAELDAVRGGYQAPQGVHFSFGIERTVVINGELQSRETMRVTDADVATLLRGDAAGANLAQALRFNPVQVIQNSLDAQVISAQTVVDVQLTGMELARQQGARAFLGEQILLLAR